MLPMSPTPFCDHVNDRSYDASSPYGEFGMCSDGTAPSCSVSFNIYMT